MTRVSIYLEVEVYGGADIPRAVIPDLIALANRMGCLVHATANDVLIMASPGDDAIDLAVAWEQEIASMKDHRIAMAWQGRQHRIRSAVAPLKGE